MATVGLSWIIEESVYAAHHPGAAHLTLMDGPLCLPPVPSKPAPWAVSRARTPLRNHSRLPEHHPAA